MHCLLIVNDADSDTILLSRAYERTLAATLEVYDDPVSSYPSCNKLFLNLTCTFFRELPVISIGTGFNVAIGGNLNLGVKIVFHNLNDTIQLGNFALAYAIIAFIKPNVLHE